MAERIQLALARVDAISAAEKVGDDAAATATNIDFSEEPGAATVRRGTLTVLGTATPYEQINGIVRFEGTAPSHYRYVVVDSGNSGGAHGDVYLATALASGFHTLLSSNGSKDIFGASQHDDWLIVAGGTNASYYAVNTAFAVAKWPLEGPGTALTPTVTTASTWSPAITWSVNEGTAVSGTTTASSTNTGTLFRIAFEGTLASTNTNLSTNGGVALGSAVLDSLKIAFSKPSAVSKVTREYSIAGTGYASR